MLDNVHSAIQDVLARLDTSLVDSFPLLRAHDGKSSDHPRFLFSYRSYFLGETKGFVAGVSLSGIDDCYWITGVASNESGDLYFEATPRLAMGLNDAMQKAGQVAEDLVAYSDQIRDALLHTT